MPVASLRTKLSSLSFYFRSNAAVSACITSCKNVLHRVIWSMFCDEKMPLHVRLRIFSTSGLPTVDEALAARRLVFDGLERVDLRGFRIILFDALSLERLCQLVKICIQVHKCSKRIHPHVQGFVACAGLLPHPYLHPVLDPHHRLL